MGYSNKGNRPSKSRKHTTFKNKKMVGGASCGADITSSGGKNWLWEKLMSYVAHNDNENFIKDYTCYTTQENVIISSFRTRSKNDLKTLMDPHFLDVCLMNKYYDSMGITARPVRGLSLNIPECYKYYSVLDIAICQGNSEIVKMICGWIPNSPKLHEKVLTSLYHDQKGFSGISAVYSKGLLSTKQIFIKNGYELKPNDIPPSPAAAAASAAPTTAAPTAPTASAAPTTAAPLTFDTLSAHIDNIKTLEQTVSSSAQVLEDYKTIEAILFSLTLDKKSMGTIIIDQIFKKTLTIGNSATTAHPPQLPLLITQIQTFAQVAKQKRNKLGQETRRQTAIKEANERLKSKGEEITAKTDEQTLIDAEITAKMGKIQAIDADISGLRKRLSTIYSIKDAAIKTNILAKIKNKDDANSELQTIKNEKAQITADLDKLNAEKNDIEIEIAGLTSANVLDAPENQTIDYKIRDNEIIDGYTSDPFKIQSPLSYQAEKQMISHDDKISLPVPLFSQEQADFIEKKNHCVGKNAKYLSEQYRQSSEIMRIIGQNNPTAPIYETKMTQIKADYCIQCQLTYVIDNMYNDDATRGRVKQCQAAAADAAAAAAAAATTAAATTAAPTTTATPAAPTTTATPAATTSAAGGGGAATPLPIVLPDGVSYQLRNDTDNGNTYTNVPEIKFDMAKFQNQKFTGKNTKNETVNLTGVSMVSIIMNIKGKKYHKIIEI